MVYLIDIESIPTRYTSQWKQWIPDSIIDSGLEVIVVDGEIESVDAQDGAFFNFYKTNIYKAQQSAKIAALFDKEIIQDGDTILFTDGWHPGAVATRQMLNISKIDAKMYGMFHAGSYDPNDILAQTGGRKHFLNFEKGLLDIFDKSFFATEFSRDLMLDNTGYGDVVSYPVDEKTEVTGFPYFLDDLYRVPESLKENIILFPHRISPEKHPEMFEELALLMPDWEFIVTMDVCDNKDDYHKLLSRAKYSISFSDQETWGISVFESLHSDCIPIVPDKLSYQEMYTDDIKYDHNLLRENIYKEIINKIAYIESRRKHVIDENKEKVNKFLTFDNILKHLKGE